MRRLAVLSATVKVPCSFKLSLYKSLQSSAFCAVRGDICSGQNAAKEQRRSWHKVGELCFINLTALSQESLKF